MTSTNVSVAPPLFFVLTVFSAALLEAAASDSEHKAVEREQTTAPPPPVAEKRPLGASAQHVSPAGGVSSISQPAAAVRAPPERTEQEDIDYDSDDASRDFIFFGLQSNLLCAKYGCFLCPYIGETFVLREV